MDLTIRDLEAYLAHQYKKYGTDQGLFMKLVEEIGEVAEAMNRRNGHKANHSADVSADLANELADVLHYAIAIAAVNDIDLTAAIIDKDARAAVKYHHDMDLRAFIAKEQA